VGDLGSKLSGGEKQRILIARALLKNSDIILLDESTSSLDSHNEKRIIDELEEALKGKTIIYCAHRLSTIVNVDTIYVMGEGKVIETGTHNELVSNPKSRYSDMWKNFLQTNDIQG
jgi:ABC-type multidrug transport system fused ATPase/permease subunit